MNNANQRTAWGRRVLIIVAGLVLALVLWLGGIAVYASIRGPNIVKEMEQQGSLSVLPADLSQWQTCALVTVQDPEFYRHSGIGFRKGNLGHTTITQSIAKGMFFNGFSPGLLHQRKIELMVMAWAIDQRISKDTQIRVFLNRTYFGTVDRREIHGFRDAAITFFGRDLQSISEQQYLALLAMLSLPNAYHVSAKPEANAARVRNIQPAVEQSCATQRGAASSTR